MRQKFGHPVVFSPGFHQKESVLVVSFCRACFRLDFHTVSIVLQSCFGGYPQGFHVHHLRERSFKFSVASKAVDFEIYNHGRIVEKDFVMVFSLWGEGGLNWRREERLFYQEEDDSWTMVRHAGGSPMQTHGTMIAGDDRRQSMFQRLTNGPESSVNSVTRNNANLNVDHNVEGEISALGWEGANRERSNGGFNCYACGWAGHFMKDCTVPRLTGLYPFLQFESFKSPPEEAWEPEAVSDWFASCGPAHEPPTVSSFRDLCAGSFPNFQPKLALASSASPSSGSARQ